MYSNERRLLTWAGVPAGFGGLIAAWCVFTSDLSWSLVYAWPLYVAITIMTISSMLLVVDLDGYTPFSERVRILSTDPIFTPFVATIVFSSLWNVISQGFAFWKIHTTVYPPIISQITSLDSKFLHERIWGDLPWWASHAFLKYPTYVALGISALHLGRMGYLLYQFRR